MLGCRPTSDALARRVAAGAEAFRGGDAAFVVACGGRAWEGVVEADAIARGLEAAGVPAGAIVRERCSLDTRDNARFAAALLARRGTFRVSLVTCAWHLARAEGLFRAAGLEVEAGRGVPRPATGRVAATLLRAREAVSTWKDARRAVRIL